jgi:hypothetical protein
MIEKEHMLAVEQFMRRVTVPILCSVLSELDHIGTGTIFKIDDRYFLITAAHIFDNVILEDVVIPRNPIASPKLQTLGIFDIHRADNENIDIAILELKEESTIEHIKLGWHALTLNNTAPASKEGTFLICGYPSVRMKVAPGSLGGSLLTAYTERLPTAPKFAEPPVDDRLDMFFAYEAEAKDINGNTLASPHLRGVSGSSIWEYQHGQDQNFWTPESWLRVVGIQSSFRKGYYSRAKTWEYVMEMLRKIEPCPV